MKYFQSDDIPECKPKKDCIHTHYKIVVSGQIIKEGRYAHKQTKNIKERVIYSRKYNVSKRKYETDFIQIYPPF